jgi:hypothetical protein
LQDFRPQIKKESGFMSKVEIVEIKCIEETDEIGSDDIYLVVVRGGNPQIWSDLEVSTWGPNPWWADFDTGETRTAHVSIDNDYLSRQYYMIAMMEADSDADFDLSHHTERVKQLKKPLAAKYVNELIGVMPQDAFAALAPILTDHFKNLRDDDELLGIGLYDPGVMFGATRVIHFTGDSGDYRLSIRVGGVKAGGVCRSGDWASQLIFAPDLASFEKESQKLFDQKGLRLIDVTTYEEGGHRRWAGIKRSGDWASHFMAGLDLPAFQAEAQKQFDTNGLRLVKMLSYIENGKRLWAGICRSGDWASQLIFAPDLASFEKESQKLFDQKGLRLIDVTTYEEGGHRRWAGIERSGDWASHFIVGLDRQAFEAEANKQFEVAGLHIDKVLTYVEGGKRLWAGICRSGEWKSKPIFSDSLGSFQSTAQNFFDDQGLRLTNMDIYAAFD